MPYGLFHTSYSHISVGIPAGAVCQWHTAPVEVAPEMWKYEVPNNP